MVIREKKKAAERKYVDTGILCNSILLDRLDLEESLNQAIQVEKGRRDKNNQLETEVERLNGEMKRTKIELGRLQERLDSMNNEGGQIDQLETKYGLLIQTFKSKSEVLKRVKLDNLNLEEEYKLMSTNINAEKQGNLYFKSELLNKIGRLESDIKYESARNEILDESLKKNGNRLEMVKEVATKSNSSQIELEKLKKWLDRRTTKSKEDSEAVSALASRRSQVEAEVAEKEGRLKVIADDLKEQSRLGFMQWRRLRRTPRASYTKGTSSTAICCCCRICSGDTGCRRLC